MLIRPCPERPTAFTMGGKQYCRHDLEVIGSRGLVRHKLALTWACSTLFPSFASHAGVENRRSLAICLVGQLGLSHPSNDLPLHVVRRTGARPAAPGTWPGGPGATDGAETATPLGWVLLRGMRSETSTAARGRSVGGPGPVPGPRGSYTAALAFACAYGHSGAHAARFLHYKHHVVSLACMAGG